MEAFDPAFAGRLCLTGHTSSGRNSTPSVPGNGVVCSNPFGLPLASSWRVAIPSTTRRKPLQDQFCPGTSIARNAPSRYDDPDDCLVTAIQRGRAWRTAIAWRRSRGSSLRSARGGATLRRLAAGIGGDPATHSGRSAAVFQNPSAQPREDSSNRRRSNPRSGLG
jgi:hypothetical protein